MGFVVFYITHPNEDQAKKIASALIEKRYVACANIYPVGSEYHWNGKIEKDAEWVSLCKTIYIQEYYLLIYFFSMPPCTLFTSNSVMNALLSILSIKL